MARVTASNATPSLKRRFVPPAPLRRVLVNFNRLGWRLGIAVAAVVLLTTVVTFAYAAYLLNDTLTSFTNSLEPTYRAALVKRFEVYESRSLDLNPLNWTDFASFGLPLMIPLSIGIIIALLVARLVTRPLERIAPVRFTSTSTPKSRPCRPPPGSISSPDFPAFAAAIWRPYRAPARATSNLLFPSRLFPGTR